MDYRAAIEIAKQRMREIGKTTEEYHMETVSITGNNEERLAKRIRINAYNEYWYLVDYAKYKGLEIISDAGYFNAEDYYRNTIQEFTGRIEITQLEGKTWSIESDSPTGRVLNPVDFIRVIF